MALTKVDAQLLNGAINADSSGNIGIGTSSPTKRLSVVGSSGDLIQATDNTNGSVFLGTNSTGPYIYTSSGTVLRFGGNSEYARFDSNGSLYVNTTGLDGRVRIYEGNYAHAVVVNHGQSGTQFFADFRYNTTGIGSIRGNNSTVSYNTSSDYRLKENIQPMTGALDKVSQLKPVTYTWKLDGAEGQGFIAHELQAVVPDCVTGEKDAVNDEGKPVYQGVDTSFLVATLTAAIQELKAELDATKAEVAALKAKL